MKNKKTLITLMLFLLILISSANISFAAPKYFYPKEYNITLLNISKEDIKKIEIFTPWGFFDDNDKTEIDGRLFNYNNYYYYNEVAGTEYNGIECKIIGIIKQKKLEKTNSGLKFSIACKDYPFDDTFGFNLRIFKKNGEVIYTEFIEQSTLVDEFSSKKEIENAKQIEKETIYVVGNYNKDKLWITPVYNNIDEYPALKETQSYLTIFVITIMIISLIIIILKKKNK